MIEPTSILHASAGADREAAMMPGAHHEGCDNDERIAMLHHSYANREAATTMSASRRCNHSCANREAATTMSASRCCNHSYANREAATTMSASRRCNREAAMPLSRDAALWARDCDNIRADARLR
jgi:hypothetical protein